MLCLIFRKYFACKANINEGVLLDNINVVQHYYNGYMFYYIASNKKKRTI